MISLMYCIDFWYLHLLLKTPEHSYWVDEDTGVICFVSQMSSGFL